MNLPSVAVRHTLKLTRRPARSLVGSCLFRVRPRCPVHELSFLPLPSTQAPSRLSNVTLLTRPCVRELTHCGARRLAAGLSVFLGRRHLLGPVGSSLRTIALALQRDVVGGVDQAIERALGEHGIGEQRIPLRRWAVAGDVTVAA